MSETIGDRIRKARKRMGLTQPELTAACGWDSQGRISNYERDLREPKRPDLEKLAKALDVSVEWLWSGQGDLVREKHTAEQSNVAEAPPLLGMVPEISWVQAGHFSEVCFVDLDPESTNWYPRPPNCGPNTYALKVVGESMLDRYPPGRIIFVDPDVAPLSGDDVIAVMTETGEATFKQYLEEPGVGKMLKARNPAWKDPYISINGNCRVTGVIMAQMELRQR
ncbi:phage repressor protein [Modicisalibacter xianhensis]|uniref:Phage repressor protein n=1 Tax=Modicisalibacter xianhensis TaxID=442341 RepID=A0A4R8FRX5_9GAMM|nr:XRE family transcriptional regulator [Halomonas xianhensis]TDX29134.1 phage repressor protein [Halomonas xianhensis]